MINLDCIFRGKRYHLNTLTGWLMSKKVYATKSKNDVNNEKAKRILDVVENPFLAKIVAYNLPPKVHISYKIKLYASFLIWLYNHFHIGLFLIAKLRLNIFDNSKIAGEIFRMCHPNNQKRLCLPRSIFIATTSKRFKENGAMFIGVFLPSKHMHAWVIEDGVNPYVNDTIWTNFTPVAMMI